MGWPLAVAISMTAICSTVTLLALLAISLRNKRDD